MKVFFLFCHINFKMSQLKLSFYLISFLFFGVVVYGQSDTLEAHNYYQKGVGKELYRDYQGALKDFDSAILANPNFYKPYLNRALMRYYTHDVKGSIDDYDIFIKVNPASAIAYDNRGWSKNILGDNQGALEDYNRSILLDSTVEKAYINRGGVENRLENGDFVRTSGLTLVAGRDIDLEKYPGDTLSCVINETSVKVLGFKSPIGQIIRDADERWKIVGVVKDFLVGDPNQASEPLFIKGAENTGYISIRTGSSRPFVENARQAEAIIMKYNPNYITTLRFADLDYAAKFQQARNAVMLVNTFAFIAIFVACMGLLGLATYMAENRTREIGIRKVLGSSVAAIVSLLAREFVRLILVSIVIASPLAWLLMQFFLQHFTYRTTLNAWVK